MYISYVQIQYIYTYVYNIYINNPFIMEGRIGNEWEEKGTVELGEIGEGSTG